MRGKALVATAAMVVGSWAGIAQAVVSYTSGTYSQNFDSLPTTGTANAWANDTTIVGWFALQSIGSATTATGARDAGGNWAGVTNIRAGDGTSNAGGLYSFGNGTNAERGLGSVGSGTPGDFVWALVLLNTSSTTYASYSLSYTGEQWRDGGATAPAVSAAQTVDFDWSVFGAAPALTDLQGSNTVPYTNPGGVGGALDFTSPVFGVSTAVALDGNSAPNRTAVSGSQNLVWAPGTYLVLRWWDDNHPGNDHALGIDDLSFSASEVPEPATIGLLVLGSTLLVRRRSH